MQRLNWIDNAKGIGIILVVIGHMNRGLIPQFNLSIQNVIDQFIYAFHMPLFFFISGFLVTQNITNGNILNKKVTKLLYLYVLWSILQGSIELLTADIKNTSRTIFDVFNLFHPIAQFWFLFALIIILVLYFLLYKANVNLRYMLVIAILFYLLRNQTEQPLQLTYLTNNFIYFILGSLFRTIYQSEILKPAFIAAILIISVIVLSSTFSEQNLMAALAGITATISLSMMISSYQKIKWLSIIGKMSLIIYLCHIIFGSGTRILITHIMDINSYLIILLLTTLTGIVLPILFWHLTKTLRLNKILFMQ